LVRLRGKDFHDVLAFAQVGIARLKMALWYSRFLGGAGRGSWMRRPSQLYGLRNVYLGDAVRIQPGVVLYSVRRFGETTYNGTIHIGDRTFINERCNLTAAVSIRVGCDVAFGPNVFVSDFNHDYETPGVGRMQTPLVSKGGIAIGDRCWIGANACIATGVDLGADCVVGANSVVTRSFPPGTVLAGAPAVAVRQHDPVSGQWHRVT
jgi:acetyltransferase-like isoleucine patch superfamily enzyme